MAKVLAPRDIIDLHGALDRRVTWLETHSTNSPGENTSLVKHIHDIVEHLFRGSMQAHTSAAPFGHLAAHYWDMEHEDPVLTDNWEFHRKMRLMRERVGANRPLVDMIGPNPYIWIPKSGIHVLPSAGWRYAGKLTRESNVLMVEPGKACTYNVLANNSHVVQPVAFPGDIARQVPILGLPEYFPSYVVYFYQREAGYYEYAPGFFEYLPQVGPFLQGYEPSEEYYNRTKSRGTAQQILKLFARASDEAVAVTQPPYYAKGGIIEPRSKRWKEYGGSGTAFNEFPNAVTSPSPSLDGHATGPFDATFGTASLPTDIFMWGSRVGGSPIGLYAEDTAGADPLESAAPPTKIKIYVVQGRTTKKSGVYGNMWYVMDFPNGYGGPYSDIKDAQAAYIPADFIQSPGPPVDYDNTQPLPAYASGEADPAEPGGSFGNAFSHGTFEDPGKPLRTFAEAVSLFEAEVGKVEFKELREFWDRHTKDFNKRGSALNHKWKDVYNFSTPAGGHLKYLVRYGYVHWQGRLISGGSAYLAGPQHEIWHLSEGVPVPIEGVMDFTVNSNLGLVQLRLDDGGFGFRFTLPAIGDIGPLSGSKLCYIDLDGISYPYV